MSSPKFSLHFAMGEHGEFGYKGKLPWGSYPSELKFFWESLKQEKHRTILVGENTWNGLPESVKDKIRDITEGGIRIVSRENPLSSIVENNSSIKEYSCIGGAYVLQQIIENFTVDKIYHSIIFKNGSMLADTYLDRHAISTIIGTLQLTQGIEHNPNGEYIALSLVYRSK